MSVILNEKEQAEKIIEKGEVGNKPTSTLFLLSKYYRQEEKLGEKKTAQKLNEFMEKNFKNKPFISSSEIELNTTEDLILLILSTIKADKSSKSFYYIEDSDETINNNGYLIPNIKFIRRS